jgi:hypothetical protein
MAIDWGAFVKGFAGAAAGQIEERTRAEREAKREADRLALVEKYKIQEEGREEARGKKKVASEQADYANGVAILYNSDREQIGTRPLTAAEIEDRTLSVEGAKLDNRNKRSTIEERARDSARQDAALNLDRQRTDATIKNLRRGGAAEGDDSSTEDRGTRPEDRIAMDILRKSGVKTEGTAQLTELNNARAAVRAAVKRGKPELAFQIYTTMGNFSTKPK